MEILKSCRRFDLVKFGDGPKVGISYNGSIYNTDGTPVNGGRKLRPDILESAKLYIKEYLGDILQEAPQEPPKHEPKQEPAPKQEAKTPAPVKQEPKQETKQPAPVKTSKGADKFAAMAQAMADIFNESPIDAEQVREIVRQELENIKPQKQVLEVKTPAGAKEIKGVTHEALSTVLNLLAADIPVYMAGPAGTGKSHIARQAAEALDLNFYFSNCVTQEYKLTGFIDANGKYHETQFYKAFCEGGLFFLDEMDGSIPEVLIHLNAALANGWFDFPTGRKEAHKDFRVIAAGNTLGTGADAQYTGRYQLDASSLDRFFIVSVDYSESIEKALTNDNGELLEFCHKWRSACKEAGINSLFTYRALDRINKLESVMSLDLVLKGSLVKDLNKDDLHTIIPELPVNNKYTRGLMCLLVA